jgi:hypothetical protein
MYLKFLQIKFPCCTVAVFMQRANVDANASLALNNKTRLYYHILSLGILLAVRDTVYYYHC